MTAKKVTVEPGKKPNKFRLVVFEGDFSDDSVSQIAQALTAALRPSTPSTPRQLSNGKSPAQFLPPDPEEDVSIDDEEQIVDGNEDEAVAEERETDKSARAPRVKSYKNPDFVELAWNGTGDPPVSLKEFAKEKAPQSRNRKYLVASYWLKEHADHPNVNIDQIYSCFKTAGWSVGFKDWRAPFDNLARVKQIRKVGTGEFTITTLGEGALQTPEA
jgi:hypothetical protein